MKPPLLCLFCWLSTLAPAQETVTVPLRWEKKLESESHGFLPLFEYGRDARIRVEGEERTIVPPTLAPDSEVAYGFVYFVGQAGGALDREALFLVEHYRSAAPRFFVDGNNNLDLTDDAAAVRREGDGDKYLLTLQARENPAHTFTVRLGFFRDDPVLRENPAILAQYETILGGYLRRMGGNATAPEHWFGDQRLNVRSASTRLGEHAFQIGLLDGNCNGSYADPDEDSVLIGEFGGEYLSQKKSDGATVIGAETLVQIGGQVFEVVEIDPAGSFLSIAPSDKPYTRLREGAPLPDTELTFLDDDRIALDSLLEPEKFLLIDFWGHWCAGCIQALPALRSAAEELADELTILSLHSGDHDQAREIIAAEQLDWLHAEASDELVEVFLVDSWPTYVLVDPQGRIRKLNTSLAEALALVRSE